MHNNSHTETNKGSMGDLAAPTVAGGPADLSRCASQPKALIDYRKRSFGS